MAERTYLLVHDRHHFAGRVRYYNASVILRSRSLLTTVVLAALGIAPAPASTSVILSASPNPSRYGQAVTLTATVIPASTTGRVTFYQGVSVIGIAAVALGRATLTTVSLPAGRGGLTAYYSGDGINAPARSAQVPVSVNSVAAQGFQSVSQMALQTTIGLQFPALAAADFNGDGKLDVIVTGAIPGATTAVILLGNG